MERSNIALCPHNLCTGCGACAAVCGKKAIELTENEEGFLYPKINNATCVACHQCQKICPVLEPVSRTNKGVCYAAWSLDNDIRTHSSSGGVFSELAYFIINAGGIVVGASLDDTNGLVHHVIIRDVNDLSKIQGSKYVQSIVTPDVLREVRNTLRIGQKVLFTGTPCQVAGIISLTKNPENLFTMDVVCHGVPSPKLFQQVHKSVRNRINNFINYNFRDLSSWSVCSNVNVNVNVNGVIVNKQLLGNETFYQDAFLKGFLHRENCYQCQYASIERVSDITVSDFWGIGNDKPITEDHKLGCSMLLINTIKGQKMFEGIKNRIYSEKRDIYETIDAGNDQLKCPSKRPDERNTFYQDAYCMTFSQLIKKYGLKYNSKPSLIIQVKSKIKSFFTKIFR